MAGKSRLKYVGTSYCHLLLMIRVCRDSSGALVAELRAENAMLTCSSAQGLDGLEKIESVHSAPDIIMEPLILIFISLCVVLIKCWMCGIHRVSE